MGDLKLLWALEHRTLLIASLVARLSSGGMPLLVLLWGYQYSNSWQAAGWAASAYALGALFTPWTGKWADRHGPSRVLVACALGMVICGIYLTFTQEWLLVWLVGVAGLSAAYPPITSSMRAYWMENQVGDQIASAWESGVVRSSYCVMPVLVALGSTALSYPLMLWIALTLNVLGIGVIVYKLSLRPHKQSFQPVRLSRSTTVLLYLSRGLSSLGDN